MQYYFVKICTFGQILLRVTYEWMFVVDDDDNDDVGLSIRVNINSVIIIIIIKERFNVACCLVLW